MKLIKLTDDHYIMVDESKQPVEGFYYDNFIKDIRDTSGAEYGQADHCWQITHSTKAMYKDEYISLSEVKELIGEVGVENKAMEIHPVELDEGWDKNKQYRDEWINGYKQALEDNKEKKYTEEDLKRYHNIMCLYGNVKGEEYIQSFQPKTSWDVEIVDGKLKLK